MAKQHICVLKYIDDIYTCCHESVADHAFHSLISMSSAVGLPMNSQKVCAPTTSLAIMRIVVDVYSASFIIEEKKLDEIRVVCLQAFLRDFMTKREF